MFNPRYLLIRIIFWTTFSSNIFIVGCGYDVITTKQVRAKKKVRKSADQLLKEWQFQNSLAQKQSVGSKRIALKNEKCGCFLNLSTIYITVSKEHCSKEFILIFSQTKLWGVFLRILTHCEKECFRNSESKAWVWHVTDNHAF